MKKRFLLSGIYSILYFVIVLVLAITSNGGLSRYGLVIAIATAVVHFFAFSAGYKMGQEEEKEAKKEDK